MRASAQISNAGIVECLDLSNQIALKRRRPTTESDEELDLVLCTMEDVIIEQLIEDSISTANEVAAKIQDNQEKKRVQFLIS